MVAVDPNSNIAEPEGNRQDEAIAVALLDAGLEDMRGHLLPC